MAQRNTWKLCKAHENCNKCNACINSWKRKANKHSANAKALKFVLMCLLDERTETINEVEGEGIPPLPVITETGKEMKYLKCGICSEKITIQGKRDMCSLSCGHTICYECASNEVWRQNPKCPFCRKVTKKVVKLFYDAEPDAMEED